MKNKSWGDLEYALCFAPFIVALGYTLLALINAAFSFSSEMTISQGFWLIGAALLWILLFAIVKTILER